MLYQPVNHSTWSEGQDRPFGTYERRWQHQVRCVDMDRDALQQPGCRMAILGFACDEGVRRNWGRPGAKEGPDAIRKVLGRFAWHQDNTCGFIDAGNVYCPDEDLQTAQQELRQRVARLLSAGYFTVLIGGGHEVAWGHYLGIADHTGEKSIGIINIDAHFDLRKPDKRGGNSGTSFFQIADQSERNHRDFKYLCLGIQKQSNSQELFRTASKYRTDWIASDGVALHNIGELQARLSQFLENVDWIYLSLCLDVFSAAYAPGVSAPNPAGLSPDVVAALYQYILQSGKVISTDIAELNPKYDLDERTARLAATMIFDVAASL